MTETPPVDDRSERGFDAAARVTLLVWLLDPPMLWPNAVPALTHAGARNLWPRLVRAPLFWAALTAVALLRVGFDWMLADNHHYLMATWCFALALARLDRRPDVAAAVNARRLVGLAFAFAVLWKGILSPDYLDGRFFRVTFLADARFELVAVGVGGLGLEDLAANDRTRARFDPTRPVDSGAEAPRLLETPRLHGAALLATAWTLGIEALVAVGFLWPAAGPPGPRRRRWLHPGSWRDPALLAFAWTTYAVAPVVGFGWLLAAMGFAQAADRRVRWLYAGTMVLILVHHRVPWIEALVAPASGL
jgi:hypothetical protein